MGLALAKCGQGQTERSFQGPARPDRRYEPCGREARRRDRLGLSRKELRRRLLQVADDAEEAGLRRPKI